MKLSISEEEFLHNFGDRNSSEFEVVWRLDEDYANWYDIVYNDTYIVRYE